MRIIVLIICLLSLHFNCSSQISETKPHYIGEKFGGGIIFYLDETGQHGLIAGTKNYLGIRWCKTQYENKALRAYNMTDGKENTDLIVKIAGDMSGSHLCGNLNIDGYKDWYLPSIKELTLLYSQLMKVGGFIMADYWSSTEDIKKNNRAWAVRFAKAGKEFTARKYEKFAVRPIRKF